MPVGKSKIGIVITAAGVSLIFCAAVLLLCGIMSSKQAASQNAETVNKILSLLPDRTNGVPGDRTDAKMPVLEIGGQDYICLIEIPYSDVRLPVLSEKTGNRPNALPYRYGGTVSDGSLVIGGLNPDFLSGIETGGIVVITDMNGNCYTYMVTGMEQAYKIGETISVGDDDLVLFLANKRKPGYTVVRCRFSQ